MCYSKLILIVTGAVMLAAAASTSLVADTPEPSGASMPSPSLGKKIERINADLPVWLRSHPERQQELRSLMEELAQRLQQAAYGDAERQADAILTLMTGAIAPEPPPSPGARHGLIALGDHDDTRKTQIFTMSENSSNRKQLTFGPDEHWMPMYSLDGSNIVYVSRSPQGMNIHVMNADGTNKKQLTSGGISMVSVWSPDGKRILYAHSELLPGGQTDPFDIWVMDADGANRKQITTTNSDDTMPTWSADGTKIAFTSNRVENRYQIFVMNADGSNPKALTTAYFDTTIQQDIEQKVPAWSPDGRYIAYWAGVEANVQSVPGIEFPRDVWVMNADGSNQRKLVIGDDPAWSPDSKTILFPACPSFTAPPGCPGGGSLSVGGISPDGSRRRILFQTNGDFGRVSWQPQRSSGS